MFEVAERFYMQLIPQAREIAEKSAADGMAEQARQVGAVIESILARPEHAWKASSGAKRIKAEVEDSQ